MAGKAKAIPEGYHTATPYLIVKGAARGLDAAGISARHLVATVRKVSGK